MKKITLIALCGVSFANAMPPLYCPVEKMLYEEALRLYNGYIANNYQVPTQVEVKLMETKAAYQACIANEVAKKYQNR